MHTSNTITSRALVFAVAFFAASMLVLPSAVHAAYPSSEVFTTTYAGTCFGFPNLFGETCVAGFKVCAPGGTVVSDLNAYTSDPQSYCAEQDETDSGLAGALVYYGGQPASVVTPQSTGASYSSYYVTGPFSNLALASGSTLYSVKSCTVQNACGASASGYQNVDGSCDVSGPSVPPGYGSACSSTANSCGEVNYGTIQCDGTCSASTPSSASCPAPTATASLTYSPSCAASGGTDVALTWSSTGATSCAGTGFSTGGATNGTLTVHGVTPGTTFSISCQ